MKRLCILTLVGSLICAAQQPAAISCNSNPIADVPEFTKVRYVKLEPDILDKIAAACDPISGVVDSLTSLTLGISQGDATGDQFSKGTGGAIKLIKFVKETVMVSGGIEAHLLKCTANAFWKDLFDRLPEPIVKAQELKESAEGVKDKAEKQLKEIEAQISSGKQPTKMQIAAAIYNGRALIKSAHEPVALLGGLATSLAQAIKDPAKLVSDDFDLEAAASVAFANISTAGSTCRLAQAENDVRTFVTLGQSTLTAARLAAAQSEKKQLQAADRINASLARGFNWQDPNTAALSRVRVGEDRYDEWNNLRIDTQTAKQRSLAVERTLVQAAKMCSGLLQQVAVVKQRNDGYQKLVADGKRAIGSCKLDDADEIGRRLRALEGTSCGTALSAGFLEAPQGTPSGLLGPTAPFDTTAVPGSDLLPPGELLRINASKARETCQTAQKVEEIPADAEKPAPKPAASAPLIGPARPCTSDEQTAFSKISGDWKSVAIGPNAQIGGACTAATGSIKFKEYCERPDATYNTTLKSFEVKLTGRMEGNTLSFSWENSTDPRNSNGTGNCDVATDGTLRCDGPPCRVRAQKK